MKADLRGCISKTSHRAQVNCILKINHYFTLCSQHASRGRRRLSECKHTAHSPTENAIKCRPNCRYPHTQSRIEMYIAKLGKKNKYFLK